MPSKIHVVVRQDIPTGPQLAQACHAIRELTHARSDPDYCATENVVVLHARDEEHLADLHLRLAADPMATVKAFREPDYDGAMTALATWGGGKLLSSLPLAS